MEISLTSLGSSQTLPRPHLRTLEASRFWSFSETIFLAADVTEKAEICGREAFIYRRNNKLFGARVFRRTVVPFRALF